MTATEPLPDDQRLKGISPKAYEHPADRAATAALQSIPMLDAVVRKLIEFGYERALRQVLLAGSVRLGDDQLPEVWASHRAALARLDLDEVPDLYLTQFRSRTPPRSAPVSRSWSSTRARSSCSTTPSCGPCSATRPATSSPTTSS